MFDTSQQMEVFPTTVDLKRIDPSLNMRRFYRMSVQPDLFGGACLVREWGRIGFRGQMLVEQHPDEGRAGRCCRTRREGFTSRIHAVRRAA